MATAATSGTEVASDETPSLSAPSSVVGIIVTPPAAEVVAESVPATPLPAVSRGHYGRGTEWLSAHVWLLSIIPEMCILCSPRECWSPIRRLQTRRTLCSATRIAHFFICLFTQLCENNLNILYTDIE